MTKRRISVYGLVTSYGPRSVASASGSEEKRIDCRSSKKKETKWSNKGVKRPRANRWTRDFKTKAEGRIAVEVKRKGKYLIRDTRGRN